MKVLNGSQHNVNAVTHVIIILIIFNSNQRQSIIMMIIIVDWERDREAKKTKN